MSKNGRYFFSFTLVILVFLFLWMYNDQKNQIADLKSKLKDKEEAIQKMEEEYQACKGEIFHKNKLLEMEKSKVNRLQEEMND